MAEQTISITLNGEAKEVAADQTGVQLFAEDKNIIAVRLNGAFRGILRYSAFSSRLVNAVGILIKSNLFVIICLCSLPSFIYQYYITYRIIFQFRLRIS